jgi:hypothetical protein
MFIPTATLTQGGGGLTRIFDSTLGADAANFDVTGIVGTYVALQYILSGRCTTAAVAESVLLRMNNDSGANYDDRRLYGNSGGAGASGTTAGTSMTIGQLAAANATAGRAGQLDGMLHNYASAVFDKIVVTRYGEHGDTASDLLAAVTSGIWLSTAAVTRLTFFPTANNFLAGSRLTLYGLP